MLIVLLVTLHSMVKIQSMKHLMSQRKKFAKDFEGCTLTELRYDKDVENRFAEEIEKYHKENNQLWVLITYQRDSASSTPQVLLSNFLPVQHIPCTDPNTAFHLITKKATVSPLQLFAYIYYFTNSLLLLSYQRDLLSRIILHVLLYPDELLLLSQRSENVTAMFFLRRLPLEHFSYSKCLTVASALFFKYSTLEYLDSLTVTLL